MIAIFNACLLKPCKALDIYSRSLKTSSHEEIIILREIIMSLSY